MPIPSKLCIFAIVYLVRQWLGQAAVWNAYPESADFPMSNPTERTRFARPSVALRLKCDRFFTTNYGATVYKYVVNFADLYPNLSPEELKEAEANFQRYIEIAQMVVEETDQKQATDNRVREE